MCPPMIDGNYLRCEMTGQVLDQQPPYLSHLESKEIEAKAELGYSEGKYDDTHQLPDQKIYEMLMAPYPCDEIFEELNLKFLFALHDYSGDMMTHEELYAVYMALTKLYKSGVDFTTKFKRLKKYQITRALCVAGWEHFHYRFPEKTKPDYYNIQNYRNLQRLKVHMGHILKSVKPIPAVTTKMGCGGVVDVSRPVVQAINLSNDNNNTEEFQSIPEAAINLGMNIVFINECIKGQRDSVLSKYTGQRYTFIEL